MSSPAFENLKNNQQQADMDGVMVAVSRQAVEEVLAEHEELQQQLDAIKADVGEMLESITMERDELDEGEFMYGISWPDPPKLYAAIATLSRWVEDNGGEG